MLNFNLLDDEFPGRLKFNMMEDPKDQATGNFEVFVGDELIHSKKRGKGRAETQMEQDAIIEDIRNRLEK
jgi:selT/selW/selH-like putative selenoprotein